MGRVVAKYIQAAIADKIDNLQVRTLNRRRSTHCCGELCARDEAELIVKRPFTLSTLDRDARVTGRDRSEIEPMLEALWGKGLVVDPRLRGTPTAAGAL
jgi:hypothetical protein